MSERRTRLRPDPAQPAASAGSADVTVAEPILLPMSARQRDAVVAALAELLATDLDGPESEPG